MRAPIVLVALGILVGCGGGPEPALEKSTSAGARRPMRVERPDGPRTHALDPVSYPRNSFRVVDVLEGEASYYAHKFHGRTTANGETFDMHQLTAAHKKLPFGTLVRVVNLVNDRTVVLRINDRGPYIDGRIIDVSLRGAQVLGFIQDGVVPVRVEVLE